MNIAKIKLNPLYLFGAMGIFLCCFWEACSKDTPICQEASLTPEVFAPTIDDPKGKCAPIRWHFIEEVDSFRVQVCRCEDFDEEGDGYYEQLIVDRFQYNFPFWINGVHYFRVKSIHNGCESEWSNVGTYESYIYNNVNLCVEEEDTFEPPILYDPMAGDTIREEVHLFKWGEIGLAERYHIQISYDSLFNVGLLYNNSELLDTQRTLQGIPAGRFWWRARAGRGEEEWTDWSEQANFRVLL